MCSHFNTLPKHVKRVGFCVITFAVLKKFLIIALFGLPMLLAGQGKWSPADSFRHYMRRKPDLAVGLDGRQSFISGHPVTITGARFGFDYWKIGFYTGLYSTNLRLVKDQDSFYSNYAYQSSTFDYYLYQTWRWQLVTTWQLGYGRELKTIRHADGSTEQIKKRIIPMECGISGTVRFLRYFGFYLGYGIRFSPVNGQGFAGPYYSGGFTIMTGTLWRDTKKLYRKITK